MDTQGASGASIGLDADDVDPAAMRRLLVPPLCDGLDSDTPSTRRSAATAVAHLAVAWPTVATAIVDDVATSTTVPTELLASLATLRAERPDRLEAILDDLDTTTASRLRGSIAEAESAVAADGGIQGPDDPEAVIRRLVRTNGDGSTTVFEMDPMDEQSDDRREEMSSRSRDDERTEQVSATAHPEPTPSERERVKRRERIEQAERSESFAAIQLLSSFEELSVVDPPRRGQFATVLPAHGVEDGADRGLSIRFLDRPDADRSAFESAVTERLAAWEAVCDVDGVLSVHETDGSPRPWLATDRLAGTLAQKRPTRPKNAVGQGLVLTRGLAELHRHGIVHGGIEPRTVAYPHALDDPRPHLDGVGLMDPFRHHFDPSSYLDPRFAAPEYFDRKFGTIDQSTDIYQLGTVIFRLATGNPPYRGSYEAIRQSVLTESVPAPSRVNPEVPEALDDIVAKATAKQKLTRYESASALYQELENLA
jgi:hypothetical protein